ncbi:WYL domain-containing protein [Pontibacter anaerobius]|uniref:WYL domain-containing protein n=1 Tax=Pontibacter anaerobius TaxID=2993940 RepID=A0ABT3R9G6_9BACT|nr:WYL domain-containing protein [Pontibacter anaerobius]MCX2738320.1 WYL domain-containing protein [Pontibacter anaerobius]
MYSYLLEELSKAIGARLLISFDYEGENHLVEPHLLGQNKQHETCLLAWRTSRTDPQKQGWHCYLLSRLQQPKIMDERFSKKRPGYDPYDSTMSRIYYRI